MNEPADNTYEAAVFPETGQPLYHEHIYEAKEATGGQRRAGEKRLTGFSNRAKRARSAPAQRLITPLDADSGPAAQAGKAATSCPCLPRATISSHRAFGSR
jgi:hypothetical protein